MIFSEKFLPQPLPLTVFRESSGGHQEAETAAPTLRMTGRTAGSAPQEGAEEQEAGPMLEAGGFPIKSQE